MEEFLKKPENYLIIEADIGQLMENKLSSAHSILNSLRNFGWKMKTQKQHILNKILLFDRRQTIRDKFFKNTFLERLDRIPMNANDEDLEVLLKNAYLSQNDSAFFINLNLTYVYLLIQNDKNFSHISKNNFSKLICNFTFNTESESQLNIDFSVFKEIEREYYDMKEIDRIYKDSNKKDIIIFFLRRAKNLLIFVNGLNIIQANILELKKE